MYTLSWSLPAINTLDEAHLIENSITFSMNFTKSFFI